MPNGLLSRPNTSDEGTWHDVFDEDKAWHRPNKPLVNPKVIFDLGAYVGYTTWDFKNQYPGATVIAVEPDKHNYHLLCVNTQRMKISKWNIAVGVSDGMGDLKGTHYNAKQVTSGNNIPVLSLDTIAKRLPFSYIDFIKFDIEGTEKEILKRNGKWWSLTKKMKIEIHSPYTVEECVEDLLKRDFIPVIDKSHPACVYAERK